MTTEQHDFEYEQDFLEDGFIPWCSCGWSGKARPTIEECQDEWENHCDTVFYDATTS